MSDWDNTNESPDSDIIATESEDNQLFKKGALNDPEGIELFKVGKLKDSNPYTNEDGSHIDGRYPKKIVVTKAMSQKGNAYYTVYQEIGCIFPSKNPESIVKFSGNIDIDGQKKVLLGYNNGSYYGLEIKTKDEMNGVPSKEDDSSNPFN